MKLRVLLLVLAFVVTSLLGVPAPTRAQTAGLCTKGRVQVMECPDCRKVLYEYTGNTILLPNGQGAEGWIGVSDPLTDQAGFVRAAQTQNCDLAAWQMRPIVPAATGRARDIYAAGLGMGNNPRAFIRIGDCNSVSHFFLGAFDNPGTYDLGPYTNLQPAIEHFAGSWARDNVTSDRGFNIASVLSSIWSDPRVCKGDETPLECEYRVHKPSFAIITMEATWGGKTPDLYEGYLRQIVDFLVAHGVVPILGTKANNNEGGHRINNVIAKVADEYGLPLWNFWLAAQPLPNHGLLPDKFHLTFARNYFGDARRMRAGWPVRNLTALQALDAVWRSVQ